MEITLSGSRFASPGNIVVDLRAAQTGIEHAYASRANLVVEAKRRGMTNADIGMSLNLTEGAVRAILKAARA